MPHDDASLSNADPDLTVVERRVLDRIFQRPLSHNLSWREVFELFRAAGEVDQAHNGNTVLKLGADHLTFAPAQGKDLVADEVMTLRHFLTKAGWSPTSMPTPATTPAAAELAIVIDHAGARIYDLPTSAGHQTPRETHHLHRSVYALQIAPRLLRTDPRYFCPRRSGAYLVNPPTRKVYHDQIPYLA